MQFALQEQQLGTGHAVAQATALLDDDAPTLVLYGDVPLTRAATLQALVAAAGDDKLGILTADLADPTGYGRIVREGDAITRIVEHKDATPEERAIQEINTGIMVAPTRFLKRALGMLRNENAQGEYYLTDVVGIAVAEGVPVVSAQPAHAWEIEGVNSKVQLAMPRTHPSAQPGASAARSRCGPGRPGAHRCARHARMRTRCLHRRGLRVRRARSNSPTACASGRMRCCAM